MTWTALLILALILSPTVVAVGVAVNVLVAKPVGLTASPASAEEPVLMDPVDSDGPGATYG